MSFHRRVGTTVIVLAAMLAATGAQANTPAPSKGAVSILASQHWDLVAWSGRDLPQGKPLRLNFDASNGHFSSSTGCNRASGSFTATRGKIRFGGGTGRFASTQMMCPEQAMATERAYVDRLAAVTRYTINGDRLTLRTAKGATLTYRAAYKPAANAPRKFIYVSAETRPCTGVGPMTCLQVREKESDAWQLYYGTIGEFEPQPGIEYRLRIVEERIANPPADSSSIRWTLDQIIQQRVVSR